ncbi:MAG TPA: hypothetical protein VM243_06605 [Phycisphaerae bacterium]|nr:hypothetical protein [Phycisphaerae bacterium]
MTASTARGPADHPKQVNLTLDDSGANVLVDTQIVHREDIANSEGPIVEGRDTSGETHPAINRAISWARARGYDVAVILW